MEYRKKGGKTRQKFLPNPIMSRRGVKIGIFPDKYPKSYFRKRFTQKVTKLDNPFLTTLLENVELFLLYVL